jgi:hypothetical protein
LLHHSVFHPDPARAGEWLACLWQGPVPADLVMRQYLYLPGEPRGMVMIWEGGAAAEAFFERAFGAFGRLETQVVTDMTPGLALALARDLEAFEAWMLELGAAPDVVARQIDLRRRGLAAPDQDAAAAEGRAWTREGGAEDAGERA